MGNTWQIVIAVINLVAVPLAAFLIRMAKGETRNDAEATISVVVQDIIRKMRPEEST